MTLRLEVLKRDYELETAKHVMVGKRVRENPLLDLASQEGNNDNLGGGFGQQQNLQLGKQQAKPQEVDDEDEENPDADKKDTKKKDLLADYMNYTGEFENWETKKVKILDVFRP